MADGNGNIQAGIVLEKELRFLAFDVKAAEATVCQMKIAEQKRPQSPPHRDTLPPAKPYIIHQSHTS